MKKLIIIASYLLLIMCSCRIIKKTKQPLEKLLFKQELTSQNKPEQYKTNINVNCINQNINDTHLTYQDKAHPKVKFQINKTEGKTVVKKVPAFLYYSTEIKNKITLIKSKWNSNNFVQYLKRKDSTRTQPRFGLYSLLFLLAAIGVIIFLVLIANSVGSALYVLGVILLIAIILLAASFILLILYIIQLLDKPNIQENIEVKPNTPKPIFRLLSTILLIIGIALLLIGLVAAPEFILFGTFAIYAIIAFVLAFICFLIWQGSK